MVTQARRDAAPAGFRQGTVVNLTATGGTAWYFSGWSGAVTSLLPTASVTMDANKSVTANFVAGVNITVSKQGQGSVTPGSGVYPKDVPKTFTATPDSGRRSAAGGLALEFAFGESPTGLRWRARWAATRRIRPLPFP